MIRMNSQRSIYLDHNATTPMLPPVVECLNECFRERLANPASQHAEGRRARKRLMEAKETIGWVVGARMTGQDRDRIIITSGGTESNNQAVRGMAGSPPGEVLISAVEHPSVLGAGEWLGQNGYAVRSIPVDGHGVVQPATLKSMISENTRLVSVMLGNNETGVIQPIAELAEICHAYQVLLHTDAVQAVGKIGVSFQDLQADALSLTAHKFHGPRGVGALIVRQSVPLRPLLVGGAQQLGPAAWNRMRRLGMRHGQGVGNLRRRTIAPNGRPGRQTGSIARPVGAADRGIGIGSDRAWPGRAAIAPHEQHFLPELQPASAADRIGSRRRGLFDGLGMRERIE